MKLAERLIQRLARSSAVRTPHAVAPAPWMLALEPRIVYDASLGAIGMPHHFTEAAHNGTQGTPADSGEAKSAVNQGIAAGSGAARPSGNPNNGIGQRTTDFVRASAASPQEVVFIDPSVSDYQALIAALPANATYVVLDPNQDGFAQMASYLQGKTGITSISLISHGMDGAIQAGSTWLTNADIASYATELTSIGASLKAGGQFQIYGCDVAEQADGQALVQSIAGLMHASVAASTDNTGAAALGGDWTLEYATGPSRAQALFGANLPNYNGLLGVTDETFDADVGFDTPGGESGTTSFTLDGITYTTDQAIESVVDSFNENQFGPPPLTSSAAPNNGVLFMNLDATPLSSVNIKLSDGDLMALQSFDIDVVAGTAIWIEANGNPNDKIVETTGGDGSETTFHIDVSGNAAFTGITSFTIVDVGDSSGVFLPTIDNLAYTDMNSPPVLAKGAGNSGFVEADPHSGNTPVVIDSGITLGDGNSSVQDSATVTISNFVSGQDVLGLNLNSSTMGNIGASFNSGTGVLTLTSSGGTATTAEWQAALDAVTYMDTAASPTTTTRNITFNITDPFSTSNTITETVAVTHTDQTPIVSAAGDNTAYTAGNAAVTVDGTVSVSDSDNTTLASATVSIGAGFQNGDTLGLTINTSTMGSNLTESYNATSGVLTLTATGATTLAQFDAALDAVKFSDTSSSPGGDRTISFVVNDGSKNSVAVTDTVDVTAAGPVVTTDSGSAAFVEADNTPSTPVAVDSGLTLVDTASPTLASATVSIGTGFHSGEDTLAFTNTDSTTFGDISETSYDAGTGVLTLTASGGATVAQWQAALRAVTYTDSAITPNTATRTISFVVNDGTNTSTAATRTVTVAATDQTPIATTTGGTTSYTAGDAATVIDSGVTVSDANNADLASATVSIGTGFQSGDTLGLTINTSTMGSNLTESYNATSGVLTLTATGATTVGQFQAALDAVTFSDAAGVAATGNRTISFVVNDGTENSVAVTKTVGVTALPVVATDSGSAAFTAGDNVASTPVAIDSGLTVADGSSTTLASATVSIGTGFQSGEDVLGLTINSATMGNNLTESYDAASGILTLTSSGSTTLAQWQAALRAVTYTDTAITPNEATRTISFTVNDGAENSVVSTRTVTVTDTDQTPVVTTSDGNAAFTAGDNVTSTPITIDPGITVSDRADATLASATVSIGTGFQSGEDVLGLTINSATMGNNLTESYNATSGILTLTSSGSTTVAQWQAALSAVTYTDTAITPNNATRTISFTVNDGTENSLASTRTVTVTDVDQTPVVTASSGNTAYDAGDAGGTIDSGITVSDRDNTVLPSATVSIGTGFQSGDTLSFNNTNNALFGNITASYDSSSGVLTLTSTGPSTTDAQWQNALAAVQFSDSVNASGGNREIVFKVNDGTEDSATASKTVTVTSILPTVITDTGSVAFVEADNATSTPVTIDPGLTVTDLGSPTLVSATVSIGTGFHSGEDTLGLTLNSATMGNIAESYNAGTGVMTLSSADGTATLAQWQAALSAVTYTDTAITPNAATRTISFVIDDGTNVSAVATRTVTVAATDQTPIVATSSGSDSYTPGATAAAIDSGISVSDGNDATLASATVSIGTGFQSGDILSFSNTSNSTFGNISATYNASNGVMTLTSASASATVAQWQHALAAVTFFDSTGAANGNRTISFVVNDGTENSIAATKTVDVLKNLPIVVTDPNSAAFVAGDNTASTPVAVDSGLTIVDFGSSTLASATVAISGNFHGGEDVLSFSNSGSSMGDISGSYNAGTGVLTLTSASGTATLAQWQTALRAVAYTDTAITPATDTRTISFTVNDGSGGNNLAATRTVSVADTDQTPLVSASSGAIVYTAQGGSSVQAAVDPGITVSDFDNTTLASATVSVGAGFQSGEDVLAFTNNSSPAYGNIAATYNAGSGVLTLTSAGASATVAQWQAALRAVTYSDTSFNPTGGVRAISFTVNDGTDTSAPSTRAVLVDVAPPTVAPAPAAAVNPVIAASTSPGPSTGDSGDANSNPLAVLVALNGPVSTSEVNTGTRATSGTFGAQGNGIFGNSGSGRTTASEGGGEQIAVTPPTTVITQASSSLTAVEHFDVGPNQAFSLPVVPGLNASGPDSTSTEQVVVRQADGQALPGWVSYNAATGVLSGTVPPNGPRELSVIVTVRDQAGHVTRHEVVLNLGTQPTAGAQPAPAPRPPAPHAALPVAKPSLAAQFAAHRRELHVA